MPLSYTELFDKIYEDGILHPVREDAINAASVDVHLGPILLVESRKGGTIDLAKREGPNLDRVDLRQADGYTMMPGEFLLAQTVEVFNLPDNICGDFILKSSGARAGLNASLAGHCDPGWHGSVLTLELSNVLQHHRLHLKWGMPVGQIRLHRVKPVPEEQSYRARGRYNRDAEAQGIKP